MTSSVREQVIDDLRALERWGDARDWSGTDPYDGLNARRFAGPLRRTKTGRQLLTQVIKRSPVNLRWLFAVPEGRSAAALAQVGSAYAINGFLTSEHAHEKLARTMRMLQEERCGSVPEPAWGYHFDVQTRVFFYPRGSPNTIATSFAGCALLDAFHATQDEAYLRDALGAGEFFIRAVPQTNGRDGAFFGYLVGDRTPIHNANMLVAALLARLAQACDREDLSEAARLSVGYTSAHQRADGSWPYGESAGLGWIDGFHTGYVLDSLLTCAGAGIEVDRDRLDRGLRFYRDALFLNDGAAKYFADSLYPIDAQCVAQGIQTFARAGAWHPQYLEFATRIFRFARDRMRRDDGSYVFQLRRLWANRAPHIRWMAAPMMSALAHLAQQLESVA